MILRYIGINPELPRELSIPLKKEVLLGEVLALTPYFSVAKHLTFLIDATKITLDDFVNDSDDVLVLHVLGGG